MTLRTPVKTVLLALVLTGLAACATTPSPDQGPSKTAATDTQQWMDRIKVTAAPDEVMLAPHATGLSANQSAALDGLMGRWLQAQARELVVTAPNAAGAMATQVRDRLVALGAPAARVRVVGFDPAGPQDAVIRVGFVRHVAEPIKSRPALGQSGGHPQQRGLRQLRLRRGRQPGGAGRRSRGPGPAARHDAPDAGRRDAVFGKYRKGEITSSAKDEQANGALSKAVK
ncbi:CpaD family pilus assembly lipoprotein [Caulobacter segnis]